MERPRYSYSQIKVFVLVLLVDNIVANPSHPFSQKRGDFRRQGRVWKKDAGKKRGYKRLLEKKGLLLTRESSGEGEAGGDIRKLEVSGGYGGIKERF